MIPDKALESSSPKKSVACRGTKREGRKLTLTKKVVGDFLASTLAATRLSVKWRISNLNLSPHFFFSWLFCRRKKRRSRDNGLHFPSFYTVWQHLFLGLLFIISTHGRKVSEAMAKVITVFSRPFPYHFSQPFWLLLNQRSAELSRFRFVSFVLSGLPGSLNKSGWTWIRSKIHFKL